MLTVSRVCGFCVSLCCSQVIGIGVADDTGETILDALIKPPHQLLDCRFVFKMMNFVLQGDELCI